MSFDFKTELKDMEYKPNNLKPTTNRNRRFTTYIGNGTEHSIENLIKKTKSLYTSPTIQKVVQFDLPTNDEEEEGNNQDNINHY
jgi:hypothetical protein